MEIKRIYIGLPEELITKIFWIKREYRINDLSFQHGGADIIVVYKNGAINGYDWIKYPSKYIQSIFNKTFLENTEDELLTLKQHVSRIFARKFNKKNVNSEGFIELWNGATSTQMPYENLEKFTVDIYEKYLMLFKDNIEFARTYLSMHFPFKYEFILQNWVLLEKGTAHYCVFISDTDEIQYSKFGLCYNKNIRWNSKMKAKYEYGFNNPFVGYVDGTGNSAVEFDEKDFLDDMIPLNQRVELDFRNRAIIDHYGSAIMPYINYANGEKLDGPNTYDIDYLFHEFSYMDYKEFIKQFEKEKLKVLVNDSIWNNTLSNFINEDFCAIIFDSFK